MATMTDLLGLLKPGAGDRYSIDDQNGNMDVIDGLLGRAAIAKKIPQRTATRLSEFDEGDTILLKENGEAVEFLIAKKNYESSLNGEGRTLLVRKEQYPENVAWNESGVNTYAGSTIDTWLNETYLPMLPEDIREAIGTTTIRYTIGGGDNNTDTLDRAVFLLSVTERGPTSDSYQHNTEGSVLPTTGKLWTSTWVDTRTPCTANAETVLSLSGSQTGGDNAKSKSYPQPSFTVPDDMELYVYFGDNGAKYTEQAYTDVLTDASGAEIYPGCRIATGTYVGTGTYGQNNPTVLTFPFEPMAIFITASDSTYGQSRLLVRSVTREPTYETATGQYFSLFTWDDCTVSFFNYDHGVYQLNGQGYTYTYTAIG